MTQISQHWENGNQIEFPISDIDWNEEFSKSRHRWPSALQWGPHGGNGLRCSLEIKLPSALPALSPSNAGGKKAACLTLLSIPYKDLFKYLGISHQWHADYLRICPTDRSSELIHYSDMHWQESSHTGTACPILFNEQKQCVFLFVFPCCCDLTNINLPNTVIQLPRCQNHKTGCKKATTERERHATPRSDISCHPEYVQQIFGIQPCSNMHWQESSHTACPILFTDQKQCVFFFVFLCCCDLTNINFRSRDQTPLFSFHGVKTTKPVARKPPQRESATGSFRNQPSVTFGCGMPHRPDCCTRLLNCKKSHFVRKVSLQQLTFKPKYWTLSQARSLVTKIRYQLSSC